MLTEAAIVAVNTPGPMRAFYERVRARRGSQIAIVAVARKLAVLFWHLLTREQDYAFQRPSLTRKKLRGLELRAGAQRHPGRRDLPTRNAYSQRAERARERELSEQAEAAYRRLVTDWKATGPKGDADDLTFIRPQAPPPRAQRPPEPPPAAAATATAEPHPLKAAVRQRRHRLSRRPSLHAIAPRGRSGRSRFIRSDHPASQLSDAADSRRCMAPGDEFSGRPPSHTL